MKKYWKEDKMKIFITGATGFIGSHVIRRLAQTQHKMFCLARKTSDVTHLKELSVNIITGDVTDKESLLKGMIGCDWVINLANLYSFWEPGSKINTLAQSWVRVTQKPLANISKIK